VEWGKGIPKEREKIGYERFESVRGECASVKLWDTRGLRV